MDVLQRVAAAMQVIVDFVGTVVAAIAGLFHVTLDASTSEVIAIVILAGFAFRLIFWPMSNAKSFQPQTIILSTAKTPWQVFTGDVRGCLVAIFWLIVIFGGLYLLGRAASGS